MRKYFNHKLTTGFVLFLLISLFGALSTLAAADERILSFHSYVRVHPDASMTVTEIIKVRSAENQIKRGIYRDFPTNYLDRLGNHVVVGFRMIDVLRDNRKENYFVKDWANGKRVYIGNKDYFLPSGEYTYTITYETNRQLGFFKDHDELYWNVTGNGWNFPIDEASVTIDLPQQAAERILETGGYTGLMGSREQHFAFERNQNDHLVFTTTRGLNSNEGLTVVVSWPKGIIHEPTWFQRCNYFIKDNWGTFLCFLGLLILLVYYVIIWDLVGKDPAKGTIIPLYSPPMNLSPAVIRYILHMGYDNKVFTAAILNMAVKGYAKIEEISGKYTLKQLTKDASMLTKEEAASARQLFSNRSQIQLNNLNYKDIRSAMTDLQDSLKKSYEKIYFHTNKEYFFWGLVFTGLFIFWGGSSGKEFNQIPFSSIVLLSILTIGVHALFYYLLKAPTMTGRKLMDSIEGFRMYLSVAEKDRLNMLNPPEKTPELFEKYLPYALALDVEQKWSQQFAEVFKRAEEAGQPYSPGWYYGPSWSSSRPTNFASSLAGTFATTIAASSSPPGSTSGGGGFSGGGSSGGGGGGGGGGGW